MSNSPVENSRQTTGGGARGNEWSYSVGSFDCGPDGFLRVPRLLDFLQETASEHARALGFDFPEIEGRPGERGAWVLSQLRLRLLRAPRWRERLVVRTAPWGVRALTANRDFSVVLDGGEPCAECVTRWALISPETRRAVRIPAFVAGFEFPREPIFAGEADPFSRLRRPGDAPGLNVTRHRAEKAHIDLNGHVNNTVYAGWLLESVPEDAVRGKRLFELEIAFRSETLLGDEVESATIGAVPAGNAGADVAGSAGGREFLHGVRAPDGGAAHLFGRSVWR